MFIECVFWNISGAFLGIKIRLISNFVNFVNLGIF